MRRLLISCTKCGRHSFLDFEGDVQALLPVVRQMQLDHPVNDMCSGDLTTATVEQSPHLRLREAHDLVALRHDS